MDPQLSKVIVVTALSLVMVIGITAAFWSKLRRGMPFGFLFIRFVALLEILPGLMILAILDVLEPAATAALIGIVVGYFFGTKSKEEESA
jgi:hypothetical protein